MILGATIKLNDQFTGTLRKASKETNLFNTGLGKVGKSISQTTAKMRILGHMTVKPVVQVVDKTKGTISRIRKNLLSLQGVAAVGLGLMGVNKLGEATLGSAMSWEQQAVSMEHWLKGNKALAKEATSWLEAFAAATPFQMDDLFPAMTRGIGITGGDVKLAERLVTLAADMAALTPGKSVQDAMEALADAQMGEFERLKEFNMKMTQEEFKKLGGFLGFLRKTEAAFAGGANKLSKTNIGYISTITDNIGTLFRSAGKGILESMAPRLEKITNWFTQNKDTVERWKESIIAFGREASERLFSAFEGIFRHIRVKYLDNPEFKQLDFAGKINFIMTDITQGFNDWLNSGGGDAIKQFGANVGLFIGEGIKSVAPTVGASAARTVLNAFESGLKKSPWGAILIGAVTGAGIGTYIFPGIGTGTGFVIGGVSGFGSWAVNNLFKGNGSSANYSNYSLGRYPAYNYSRNHGVSRASGVPYIPRDNYQINAHRGEMLLTRREADQYRRGQAMINITIPKLAEVINASNPNDVDEMLTKIENRLLQVALNMGRK